MGALAARAAGRDDPAVVGVADPVAEEATAVARAVHRAGVAGLERHGRRPRDGQVDREGGDDALHDAVAAQLGADAGGTPARLEGAAPLPGRARGLVGGVGVVGAPRGLPVAGLGRVAAAVAGAADLARVGEQVVGAGRRLAVAGLGRVA
ncbi:MAG: hypothetical protein EP329_26735, partial [Deltaproteobacteria bacterium]